MIGLTLHFSLDSILAVIQCLPMSQEKADSTTGLYCNVHKVNFKNKLLHDFKAFQTAAAEAEFLTFVIPSSSIQHYRMALQGCHC